MSRAADHEQFKGWSTALARALDAVSNPSVLQDAFPALMGFVQYFSGLIEERRRQPDNDLLSALIAAEAEGDRLSTAELFAMCIMLFVAGHETTTNLIGNGTLALLRHPEQFAALRAGSQPRRAGNGGAPAVRCPGAGDRADGHRGPGSQRYPARPPGSASSWFSAAANRDPRFCPEPDRLILARGQPNHVAFGSGIHACLGAAAGARRGPGGLRRPGPALPGHAAGGHARRTVTTSCYAASRRYPWPSAAESTCNVVQRPFE